MLSPIVVAVMVPAAVTVYEDALERSRILERAGRPARAAEALEPLTESYPQDHALFLRLGWLYFSAGDYPRAELAYARAADLSGGGHEARLGLGWTALRRGRRSDAEAQFSALVAADASDERAREGLNAARTDDVRVRAVATGVGHVHTGHVTLDAGIGATFLGQVDLGSEWIVGGAYRYTNVGGDGVGQGAQAAVRYIQHEGYAWLGWGRPDFGFTLHYGLLDDTSGTFGQVHAFGATARVSPFGDLFIESNATLYEDLTIVRFAPGWRIPFADRFFVEPGGGVQFVDGEAAVSGRLTFGWIGDGGGLWLGGTFGRQIRPTSFAVPMLYDLLEEVRLGTWVGGRIRIVDRFFLLASWTMTGLEIADDTGLSAHHVFTLGGAIW